ncbi:MAG: acyl-CoA dehydrogenase family protein [Hyphomicrobium sp.]
MPPTPPTDAASRFPPPFEDVNLYSTDTALSETVEREGGGAAAKRLAGFGLAAGSREAMERGRLANEHPPKLKTHDAYGRRLDRIEYHPAYHELLDMSVREGLHAAAWSPAKPGTANPPLAGAHVVRAAGLYMAAQMDAGHCCPIAMTHAAVPTLRLAPQLAANWLPKLLSRTYDPGFEPADSKAGLLIGLGLTEAQGGTDARTSSTLAVAATSAGPDGEYLLTGHKWFLSAPMSDAFVVLAQTTKGPTCFLLPRILPDGSANAIHILRLKDKLGNRSNASAEVDLQGARATIIGEDGRGALAIQDMVTGIRLDCATLSAGLMRFALAHAIHHAEHANFNEKRLADQPVMQQVLADLALDVEAATALSFRLARAFDHAKDERASAWRRLMTPVTRYWVCKIAPALVAEAMECLGGNGTVEELPLARIYREVPGIALWEGPGNVLALDVLRVLQREPDIAGAVMDELGQACGDDAHLEAAHARLMRILHEPRHLDGRARALVEGLAVLAAGTILRAHAPPQVADAFIATRMGVLPRQTYGQGLDWAETRAIIRRASAGQS